MSAGSNGSQHFNIIDAEKTMSSVEDIENYIKSALDSIVDIIDENVGNESVWAGQSATDYKKKFEKASSDFSDVIKMIGTYASSIHTQAKNYREANKL